VLVSVRAQPDNNHRSVHRQVSKVKAVVLLVLPEVSKRAVPVVSAQDHSNHRAIRQALQLAVSKLDLLLVASVVALAHLHRRLNHRVSRLAVLVVLMPHFLLLIPTVTVDSIKMNSKTSSVSYSCYQTLLHVVDKFISFV
jgi:hypothetical protein